MPRSTFLSKLQAAPATPRSAEVRFLRFYHSRAPDSPWKRASQQFSSSSSRSRCRQTRFPRFRASFASNLPPIPRSGGFSASPSRSNPPFPPRQPPFPPSFPPSTRAFPPSPPPGWRVSRGRATHPRETARIRRLARRRRRSA